MGSHEVVETLLSSCARALGEFGCAVASSSPSKHFLTLPNSNNSHKLLVPFPQTST